LRLLGDQTELLFEGVVPALCQLRVPVGYIRMEVSVEGFRPVSKEAVINEDRLSIASIALDVAHSPWHTLVVHSPIDFGLDARIVERRNLRLYVEAMSFQDSRMFANIAYFGPEDPSRRAGLTLRLDLPIVPQEIELFRMNVFGGNFGATGWTEFSAGPNRGELRSVYAIAGQTEAAAPAHIQRGGEGGDLAGPWEAAMAPLIERGGRELWLDYDVGPGPVGDSYVYMQILRAESLPNYVPDPASELWPVPTKGDFLWHPALLIRVR
jgi:hypothetical protein